jgi:hypothetical protein
MGKRQRLSRVGPMRPGSPSSPKHNLARYLQGWYTMGMPALPRPLLLIVLLVSCGKQEANQQRTAELIYFGFDNRAETPEDVLYLAKMWGDKPPCPHWRTTIKKDTPTIK